MSLRGTKISRSITFELSTSSAFSSSAENVTNWPRSYSYPLTTRDFSISSPVLGSCGRNAIRVINRARHQRKTQKTGPTRVRHQRPPSRPAASLQSISYRKRNQVVKPFPASPALLKTVCSRLDLQYTMLIRLTPKNPRFSHDGWFRGSPEARPLFLRGISDVAMNPCTGRHTSGLQPAR
jgi:hypothetical protein